LIRTSFAGVAGLVVLIVRHTKSPARCSGR